MNHLVKLGGSLELQLLNMLFVFILQVEQRQYELLELLLATPWSDDAPGSSASSTSSSASTSSSCALLVFLRFLLQKNMYSLRDVSPPGLSEPTVLMSAFFGLLQMLQPALQAACDSGSGPLAAFPAAELFAGVGPAAEAEPVFNMPRLGGVVTHLAREHAVSAAERQPVAVLQQQAGGRRAEGSAYGGSPHLQVREDGVYVWLYAWHYGWVMSGNVFMTLAGSTSVLGITLLQCLHSSDHKPVLESACRQALRPSSCAVHHANHGLVHGESGVLAGAPPANWMGTLIGVS